MFKRLLKSVRNNMVVGLVLVTPILATIFIFNFLFRLTTAWLPASAFPRLAAIWNGTLLRLLTLVAVLAGLFLIGLLTRNILGRRLYHLSDRIMTRIPLFKTIYLAVRKISEALLAQRKTLFKEVVLVEYPRKGIYSLAFVTTTVVSSISDPVKTERQPGEPCVNLFIATSPNPTSGLMIIVPRSQVVTLNLSVADAMTFIMSAGTVQPGDDPNKTTLIERIEEWMREERGSVPGTPKALQSGTSN